MVLAWTASKIDAANYCTMKYYLRYERKEPTMRMSYYDKGSLLHSLIEHFWDRLGTPEEAAKKSSPKKYSNAEEFQKYAIGKWMQRLIASENSGNDIIWTFKGQKWAIKKQISNIAPPLFDYLKKEGRPIFSEIGFKFRIDDMVFRGRIDEVRMKNGKVVIRDYKSGKPWLDQIKVNGDPQLTFYNIGLAALCHNDPKVAKKLNLEERAKNYFGNPIYIDSEFEQEFFMIEALPIIANPEEYPWIKTIPEAAIKTKRRDAHFYELVKMIQVTNKKIKQGDVYPERGRKCGNCDVKKVCEEELDNVNLGQLKDKNNQLSMSFVFPAYIREEKIGKKSKIITDPNQIKLTLKRKSVRNEK